MKIEFNVGDIVSDAFAGIKPSDKYKLTFLSEWYWGHSVLIDKTPIKYHKGMVIEMNTKQAVDIANLGDLEHPIIIEFLRIE